MIYILDNLIPILCATIAAFAFGAIWYMMLSKPWMAAAGLTEAQIKGVDQKPSPLPFIIAFVCEFWMAAILAGALILAPVDAGGWTVAIGTSMILWIGFVVPTMLVNNAYQMKPLALSLIDGGHWLGVLIVMAIVLRLIGVVAPASSAAG